MTVPDAARWPGQEHRHLKHAVGYADGVLDAVDTGLMSSPTPCRAWNLRMLLEHADDSLAVLIEGFTTPRITAPSEAASPGGTRSAADLVGAFRQRAAELLDASARREGGSPVSVEGHPLPLDCLRMVGALEIAVHAWDVSQACGQRLAIPGELATALLEQVGLLVPRLGREPLFAAPVALPAQSTSGERLIAYLGRPVRQDLSERMRLNLDSSAKTKKLQRKSSGGALRVECGPAGLLLALEGSLTATAVAAPPGSRRSRRGRGC